MVFEYENFGDTLRFAEALGWIDPDDNGFPDEIEASALQFIQSKGYKIEAKDIEDIFKWPVEAA